MTYSLKTGKKLTLDKVCSTSSSKIASTLKKKIKKDDPTLKTKKVTKNNVKNMNYYLMPNKKAVVCFKPYELGCGGWTRTYTINSKYK